MLVTLHRIGVDKANKRKVVLTEHLVRSFLESWMSLASSSAQVAVVKAEAQTVGWRTSHIKNSSVGILFNSTFRLDTNNAAANLLTKKQNQCQLIFAKSTTV